MTQTLTVIILPIINLLGCVFLLITCFIFLKYSSDINEGKIIEAAPPKITVTITFRIAVVTVFEALLQISIMTLHNHEAHLYELIQGIVMSCIILLGIFIVCYFQKHRSIKHLIQCIFRWNIRNFIL